MASKNFLDYAGLTKYTQLLQEYMEENYHMIYCNTTAYWDSHPSIESIAGAIYIYSDYKKDGSNNDIPGIKVGDGNAYVADLQFIDYRFDQHLLDTVKHITAEERTAWNNKVRCYVDSTDTEKIVFTTN